MTRCVHRKQANRWIAALRLCALLLWSMSLASPATADCIVTSGNPGTATISLPATISVPRDTPTGTVLYDSNWVAAGPVNISCSGTFQYTYGYASPMQLVPGYSNVYQTTVAGIGIKAGWANWMSGTPSIDSAPLASPPVSQAITNQAWTPYGPMSRYRMQMVVTGPVRPGTVTLPPLLAQASYGSLTVAQLMISGNTQIIAPACTVQTPSLTVNMPPLSASAFQATGSTAGQTAFRLLLSCSGPTAIAMTLTDATQPGNTGSNLSLASGSSAGGVAYQILYNGTPMSFGPASAVAGNLHQFNVGTVTGASDMQVPLTARYIRTGTVTPGTANAAATFTMSYQ
ncbi:fimbrial protein [Cupriavidus sp. SS-3]|uniref:fimbrial protein n=1 Tax=Cupriavidus sp. SS-3 TaxID=3109596 RepID=UPI002DBF65EA|nr:fimbrial protein [Cupriavidus sp. SS-3]MEC3765919.1 fimbrial protein [Cupriavidus sp. SS-3]